MGLSNLGKIFFETAKQHGKAFLKDVIDDIPRQRPSWEKIRSDLNRHSQKFRQDFAYEFQLWLEKEVRENRNFRTLFQDNNEIKEAYELLGLSYGADLSVVKQRWRDLLKETHPDRFMGDPVAYQKATERTQKLTAAYHCIMKAKEDGLI